MAKVSKSYQELIALVNAINTLLSSKEFVDSNQKGVKKLQKIGEKVKTSLADYNEKLEDLKLDNAHTDETGALVLDEKGGYRFSKEGLKSFNTGLKNLLKQEFDFYQLTFSSEGIEDYQFLEGWVEGLNFPKPEFEIEEAEVIPMEAN